VIHHPFGVGIQRVFAEHRRAEMRDSDLLRLFGLGVDVANR
jgi:hypothetical protein